MVKVDNSRQKNSRWYSGSGIYRHAWLITTEKVHLDHWGIQFTSEKSVKGSVQTTTKISLRNEAHHKYALNVVTTLTDNKGRVVGSHRTPLTLSKGDSKEISQKIKIKNPSLWTLQNPNLYSLEVKVLHNSRVVDRKMLAVGIRDLKFSSEKGFLLNGKSIKLNGGCIHHDNGALGAAAYDRAEERKVLLLKQAGFNAVRTAHNPPSEKFLDACDHLGLLVIDESFDGWRAKKTDFDYARYFDLWWRKDVGDWIQRDRNHPSVIMWSTGNEIIERTEIGAVQTAQELRTLIRRLDSTRPVTSAITTWDDSWSILDPLFAAHDIGGYNYQLDRASSDHIRVPERVIFQSESYPRDAYKNWKLVTKNKYIIGDFVWTAKDYLGESGIGRFFYDSETKGEVYDRDQYPWHGAYCGDIDLTGFRKPISHYRELLYNESKKLYLAVREPNGYYGKINETLWSVWPTWESWTWPGHEGKPIEVEVYSRYPKLRLYLNDRLIEEKLSGENQAFKTIFTLPYQPGQIKVLGFSEDGRNQQSAILKSAGAAAKISLTADRKNITADGQDLCFVRVEIQDLAGTCQPNSENLLKFELEGPGKIIGVDNANLKDLTSYKGLSRNAWKGKGLVIIKSLQKPGKMKLKVRSEGIKPAEVIIESR